MLTKYFIGVKNLVTDNNRLPGLHYIRNIAILLMRPTLCRSKQCCQVLAIKVKVMNE